MATTQGYKATTLLSLPMQIIVTINNNKILKSQSSQQDKIQKSVYKCPKSSYYDIYIIIHQ